MPEVHALGVALGEERGERLDAVLVGVEVRDAEAVAAEARPAVGDRPEVVEVVAVTGVGDHDPPRVDAGVRERLERDQAGSGGRARVHHHGRARLDARGRDRREHARDVADDPVVLDRALEETRP